MIPLLRACLGAYLGAYLGACLGAEAPAGPAGGEVYAAHDRILVLDGSRRIAAEVALDEVINAIAFSPDGRRAFVGTSGGKDLSASRGGLYVIDAAAHRVAAKPLSDPVKELRVSPDGKRLHVLEWKVRLRQEEKEKGAQKKRPVKEPFQLRVLDISGEEVRPVASFMAGMDLYDLAVSPDGRTAYLLDPGHNGLRVMDLQDGRFLERVELSGGRKDDGTRFEAALSKMALAPDGRRAAVLQSGPARTGALLLDLDARTRRQVLLPNGSNLRAGRFDAQGKRLLALSLERILVIDPEAGKLLASVPLEETFTSMAVSADGREVYLGTPVALRTREARGGGMVEVRDAESLALLTRVPLRRSVRLLQAAPGRRPAER